MTTDRAEAKLIATAIGAGAFGALFTLATTWYINEKKQEKYNKSKSNDDERGGITRNLSKESYIFNDNERARHIREGQLGRSTSSGTILFPHNHEDKMKKRILHRASVEQENRAPRKSVTVKVPASSANMGPGYDCIGCAVDLWSELTVERADKFEIIATGEGAEEMPKDATNYMVVGVKGAFDAANKPMPLLKYTVHSKIPYARGMGSSSAAIVSGIIAGLVLAGHQLPCWGSEALLQIAASIEGHPDNVAPVIYGGIQLGIHTGTRWMTERVPMPPGIQLVMFIPDFVGKTSDARDVLKNDVTREDAAYNISRAAFLVHALCHGQLDNLKYGVQDRMHQPQRGAKLYTYLYPMIEAAEQAGACCAYLSGAGPTVMALTSGASGDIFTQREKERTDWAVANAMIQAGEEVGIKGKLLVTQVAHEGAKVIRADPPFSSGNIHFRDDI
mmetsp:Transcript_38200/g.44493  ORF Transcript_38200/g.44493 Transcript_38200/m.44493 type:complete len:447 (-) Transcript_38200:430-1770(-)